MVFFSVATPFLVSDGQRSPNAEQYCTKSKYYAALFLCHAIRRGPRTFSDSYQSIRREFDISGDKILS